MGRKAKKESIEKEEQMMGKSAFEKTGKMHNLYRFNNNLLESIWGVQRVVATEKIHGTQGRIFIRPDEVIVGTRRRTVNFGDKVYPQQYEITHALGEAARKQMLEEGEVPCGQVSIFGEYAGEGVQKGVKYTESGRDFWAFAVLIGESLWLDTLAAKEFCDKYSINFVPILYEGPPNMEVFNSLYEQNSHILNIEDNMMEGIVITSYPLMRNVFGQKIQAKHKNDKWSESTKTAKKPAKTSEYIEYAKENVNEIRVLHAVDKLREADTWKRSMEDMRDLIMEIMADLKSEVGLGDLDERKVRRSMSKLTAKIYKAMLQKGDLL